MKKEMINWTIVFWVSITILFLWLFAKSIGLIHTPIIIESIPYIVGFLAILSIAKNIGRYLNKIDSAFLDIKEIKIELKDLKTTVTKLEFNFTSLDKRVAHLETKM